MRYVRELQRKAIHQLALIIPISYLYLSKSLVLQILAPITILVIIVDISRLRIAAVKKLFMKIFKIVLRPHEKNKLTGSTYFLTATVITIWLFPKDIAIYCIMILIVSDTLAALVGKRIGKHKIFDKSVEGSSAFFISAFIIGLIMPDIPLIQVLTASFSSTILELIPVRLDDNFRIPVGTCMVLYLLF